MNAATPLDLNTLRSLLLAAAEGDRPAFGELYQRTSAKLYGICLSMLHQREEADEVLQEVYVTVWRRATSFDPARASPMTWLITLARNKAIDRLRQRRETVLDDLPDLASDDPTPATDAEMSQERRRLHDCMDKLEPTQKSAVREAFFRGATYMELAARQKVPLGTMKSWIRRSLIRLRTCLDQ